MVVYIGLAPNGLWDLSNKLQQPKLRTLETTSVGLQWSPLQGWLGRPKAGHCCVLLRDHKRVEIGYGCVTSCPLSKIAVD